MLWEGNSVYQMDFPKVLGFNWSVPTCISNLLGTLLSTFSPRRLFQSGDSSKKLRRTGSCKGILHKIQCTYDMVTLIYIYIILIYIYDMVISHVT